MEIASNPLRSASCIRMFGQTKPSDNTRVHMKITFKGAVTGDIREFYGTIITGIICDL